MKKITLSIILCLSTLLGFAQSKAFMLTGASFAVAENGWFELGCKAFNVEAINKAVSGQAILQTAMGMYNGTFYTTAQLDRTEAFIIMHVHNQNVANTDWLKENYEDYEYSAISTNYSCAYDYVIKRYKADCLALKDEPSSQYYGTENGKPATIVLCTHWHDSRTIYNPAIRTLASKWNLPLIKWDENIGFTKDVLENGKQPSLKYAGDTENIGNVTYGWHPLRGSGQYIQQKMASIFIQEMETIFGEIPVTASVQAKNPIIFADEEAYVSFSFTGVGPWDLTYDVNGSQKTLNDITENPCLVKIDVPENSSATVTPISVSNASEPNGSVSGEAIISYALKSIPPSFDTYVHENSKTTEYTKAELIELKAASDGWSRYAYISFDLTSLDENDYSVVLRLFFNDLVYSVTPAPVQNHLIGIFGNTNTYTSFTWNTKPTDFAEISSTWVAPTEKGSFINFDISDWAKEQAKDGKTTATLQLRVINDASGLFRFPSTDSKTSPNVPVILTAKEPKGPGTGLSEINGMNIQIENNYIRINESSETFVTLYSVTGNMLSGQRVSSGGTIDISSLLPGIYLLSCENTQGKSIRKFVKK